MDSAVVVHVLNELVPSTNGRTHCWPFSVLHVHGEGDLTEEYISMLAKEMQNDLLDNQASLHFLLLLNNFLSFSFM